LDLLFFCKFDQRSVMTTIQLKEKLISKISTIDNEELLNQISRLIDLEIKTDEVYELSFDETEAVKEGNYNHLGWQAKS